MSKPSLSFRVPRNMKDEIETIQDREGIEDRSEAARQVLRRGIEHSRKRSAGEELSQQATAIAGVGSVAALIGSVFGHTWAAELVVPFAVTTFVFAILWASVLALEGRKLL